MRVHTFVLLRHAKSDYPPGVPDHDRPLSARGRREAATIAGHLKEFLPVDATIGVAVSTAVRAQQTWAAVSRDLDRIERRWDDAGLYLAQPEEILEAVGCFDTDIGIVVGHNPGLEQLARSFPAPDPDVERGLGTKFPTSAFAVITRGACEAFVTCR